MSVDDVIQLVGNIDGLNRQLLADYSQRLIENNINGAVLLSCDLVELKPVVQMAFGDWVLMRSLVETLRYQEQTGSSFYSEDDPPTHHFVRPAPYDVDKLPAKDTLECTTTGAVANAVVSSSMKVTSAATVTSVSNIDVISAGSSQSVPPFKPPPSKAGDKDDVDNVKPATSLIDRRHISRQDSFVGEVLMESETLRGFIQASVVGSDSDDSLSDGDDKVRRSISAIPEEPPPVSRNASGSSVGRASLHRQISVARQFSVDSNVLGPGDREFSVGPDQDSGESDSELETISRRSSVVMRQGTQPHVGSVTKPPETDTTTSSSSASEEKHRKSSIKALKHGHDSQKSPQKHSTTKVKSTTKVPESKSGDSTMMPLINAYFPLACEPGTRSERAGYVSPKSSHHTMLSNAGSHRPISVAPADSSKHSRNSPESSTVVRIPSSSSIQHTKPSTVALHQAAAVSSSSQLPEQAEVVNSDNVKFFIVDESDTSPKAIMVEMDSLPPHYVSSSLASGCASQHDLYL